MIIQEFFFDDDASFPGAEAASKLTTFDPAGF
jgi:hypothetical protein